MANGLETLFNPVGSFLEGKRARIADDEQKRAISSRNQLAQLAGQAFSAPPDQRQNIMAQAGQAGGLEAASQFANVFKSLDDNQRSMLKQKSEELGRTAYAILQAPREQQGRLYMQALEQAKASGMDVSAYTNLDPMTGAKRALASTVEVEKLFAQLYPAPGTTPAGLVEFNAMSQGMSQEDQTRARRIALGLDPRQSSAAIGYQKITGADGREYLVATDPRGVGAQTVGGGASYGTFGGEQRPSAQPQSASDPELLQAANSIMQTLRAQGVPTDKAEQIADKFLQDSAVARGGQVYPGDSAPQVGNPFASRAPEDTVYRTEQAKNLAAREQMPYETDQARAKAQAEAEAKAYADRSATDTKRSTNANRALELLDEAEKLIPESTGSALGQVRDAGAALFGESTTGAKNIAGLNAIAGQLIAIQPRMEGPQSNYDVKLYTQMAGDLANAGLPVETRMAAAATIRRLQMKYAGQGGAQSQQSQGATARQASNAGGMSLDDAMSRYGGQ